MSGDEMIFDPTMSKKEKKKKNPFMSGEEGDAQTEETQPSETKTVEPEPTEDKDVEADEEDNKKKDASDDLDDLSLFNQKKKKNIDEAEEGIKDLKTESDIQEPAEPEDDLDIMLGNKKKKKKNVKFPDEDEILEKEEALEDEDSKKDDGISFSNQTDPAWAGSSHYQASINEEDSGILGKCDSPNLQPTEAELTVPLHGVAAPSCLMAVNVHFEGHVVLLSCGALQGVEILSPPNS
ncbi:Eukaryotic translation initiation factor 2 subunit 2 [Heterocephalus glaber]|uniref:Eukaryotic translation initiation factor 2 subunit 2 n=1 Tax=Heterocephalus glaber TaxID=10181 RepID=G5C9S0_HETGA|nr:Eukaryotic translation initiation factor 2 subunit 2 [Heterocephalus glaber]